MKIFQATALLATSANALTCWTCNEATDQDCHDNGSTVSCDDMMGDGFNGGKSMSCFAKRYERNGQTERIMMGCKEKDPCLTNQDLNGKQTGRFPLLTQCRPELPSLTFLRRPWNHSNCYHCCCSDDCHKAMLAANVAASPAYSLIVGDTNARAAWDDHGSCADIGTEALVRSSEVNTMFLACPSALPNLEIVILVDTSGSFGSNRVQEVGDFIKTLAVRFNPQSTFFQIHGFDSVASSYFNNGGSGSVADTCGADGCEDEINAAVDAMAQRASGASGTATSNLNSGLSAMAPLFNTQVNDTN